MAIELRSAEPNEALTLTAIAFAAKRHWGYPEAWIDRWRDVLTITPAYVADHACFVAREDGTIVGFVALRAEGADRWIDHLWVLPGAMGHGIGRQLFSRALDEASRAGAARVLVESDPHAEGFYFRMGARTLERLPAPIDGIERLLPVMEKSLG
jgi:GNAT superfamily N-acetyltransferase